MVGHRISEVDRHVFRYHLLRGGIERDPLLLIVLLTGFSQHRIDLWVTVLLCIGPDHALLCVVAEVGAMHTDHRVTPVEDHIHGHVEVPVRNCFRPGRKPSRGSNRDIDANLFQLRLHVFRHGLSTRPPEVNCQRETHVVSAACVTCFIKNRIGFVNIQIVARNVGLMKNAVRVNSCVRGSRRPLHDRVD